MTDDENPETHSRPESDADRLERQRREHRALDKTIADLTRGGSYNQLEVMRLKRDKLALKDSIARLKARLYPDIIA